MTTIETRQLETVDGAKNFIKNLSEDYIKNLTKALRLDSQEKRKEEEELSFKHLKQQKILRWCCEGAKDHQKITLHKTMNENNKVGVMLLDSSISFTKKGGLIVHTAEQGNITFSPKQVTLNDIKDIDGIETNKNIWIDNPVTGESGLWVSPEAIKLILNTGKKILSDEQFLAIKKTLKGQTVSYENILFNLLGSNQYGLRNRDGKWRKNMNRCLNTVSSGGDIVTVYDENYNYGIVKGHENCSSAIRFVET